AAHLRGSGDALSSDNLPPELAARSFARNQTDHVLEAGASGGGPLAKGRLWLWGSAGMNELKQETLTGPSDTPRTANFSGQARLGLGAGSLSLLALHGAKTDEDRDTTLDAAPAARWEQSSPTTLVGLEDRHPLGAFALTARLSWLDGGVRLDPHGGD